MLLSGSWFAPMHASWQLSSSTQHGAPARPRACSAPAAGGRCCPGCGTPPQCLSQSCTVSKPSARARAQTGTLASTVDGVRSEAVTRYGIRRSRRGTEEALSPSAGGSNARDVTRRERPVCAKTPLPRACTNQQKSPSPVAVPPCAELALGSCEYSLHMYRNELFLYFELCLCTLNIEATSDEEKAKRIYSKEGDTHY